ncbi:MAG: alpha-L-arabinofuranosidase, partial [Bacteroidales bacterium]|nr:alpha-L-arabinofuranosidase [Bacteroidales bacterium]
PKEQRKGNKNTWGYHQSMAIGYFEYFQFCEDLGMEPVPILPCGVSCQGTNGGWNMWPTQAQDACPMSDMDEWTQDALDLIEWANGDVNTKWGKVRADAGHPKPFNLKYLGIGNEEKITPEFEERFKYMYDKITAKYPNIVIVGTAGPGSHAGNPDYEEGWKFAEKIGLPIIDEHYYEPRDYFLSSRQYDNYPRNRKTKVYLGEYAAKDKKLIDALAEGLYLLHVERNADIVVMTSYAPLFARRDNTNWNPDLIYFDNERPYLTCSYYVQQMFGQSSGDYYYGDCVKFDRKDDNLLGQSVVYDSKTKKLFVKICNAGGQAAQANIDLTKFKIQGGAEKTTISGNPNDENNYDKQPIMPIKESVSIKSKFAEKVEPYSITMWTIQL